MASERSRPGVRETAVAPWGSSSCASADGSHRRLGEVVEERVPVVAGVVLFGAVVHLDDEPARRTAPGALWRLRTRAARTAWWNARGLRGADPAALGVTRALAVARPTREAP